MPRLPRKTDGLPAAVANSKDHAFAITCVHCTDTCNSHHAYVSTYCHLHHEHLAGFSTSNIMKCRTCTDYKPRDKKK